MRAVLLVKVEVSNGGRWEAKNTNNSTTEVSFSTISINFVESVHNGEYDGGVRIFVGLSCEL